MYVMYIDNLSFVALFQGNTTLSHFTASVDETGFMEALTSLARLACYQDRAKKMPRQDSSKNKAKSLSCWMLLDHALHIGCKWVSKI